MAPAKRTTTLGGFRPSGDPSQVPLSKQRTRHFWDGWVDVLTGFDISKAFDEKPGPRLPRRVIVGQRQLPEDAWTTTKRGKRNLGQAWEYSSNQIRTAKYTLVTFIPRNLLEQFRRIANIFFLVLVILQFIPKFQQVSPALSALPLLVVLGITALKDAYEDIRRRRADMLTNSQRVLALRSTREHHLFGIGSSKAQKKAADAEGLDLDQMAWSNPNRHRAKDRIVQIPNPGALLNPLTNFGIIKKKAPEPAGSRPVQDAGNASGAAEGEQPTVAQPDAVVMEKKHWWSRKRAVAPPQTAAPGGGEVTSGAPTAKPTVPSIRTDLEPTTTGERPPMSPSGMSEYQFDDDDLFPEHAELEDVPSRDDGRPRKRSKGPRPPVAFLSTTWEDVRCGDFIKLRCDDQVPADMVICATSDEEDVCYVETKNLDGETNLKSRHAVKELALGPDMAHAMQQQQQHGVDPHGGQAGAETKKRGLRNAMRCARAKFEIDSEAPNVDMFKYSAAICIPSEGLYSSEYLRKNDLGKTRSHGGGAMSPLSPQRTASSANALQRTTTGMSRGGGGGGEPLRLPVDLNTVLLRGTVVRNTEWVIGIVVFTGKDTKIVMNSSGTPSKRSKVERQMNPMVFINLGLLAAMCMFNGIGSHFFDRWYYPRNSYWTVGEDESTDNTSINGAVAFANAMITYQNIVPISLYISIEFVRTVQAAFIWADDEIYYKPNKRRTLARSWNLSDDLGQVQYIFSDKTGTLTQNVMQFRQCSVAGKKYVGDAPQEAEQEEQLESLPSTSDGTRVQDGAAPSKAEEGMGRQPTGGSSTDDGDRKVGNAAEVQEPFRDSQLTSDLDVKNSDHAQALFGFFATLGLCHTVLAAEDENGVVQYKAQSPDEAALVQAAADVGFVFRGRDHSTLRLQVPHDPEVNEYELLEVIEFTSARKRMSVVVKKLEAGGAGVGGASHSGDLLLLTKGADNIIFDRLAPSQEQIKEETDAHLEEFANEGLRTLCLAYRRLDEATYSDWARRYQVASATVDGRDEAMEKVQDELEVELRLLGATAIEDKLQDGVPEAIADLKRSGIKVWVATGDKLETAIAIAKSCNLIARDMNLIVVKGGAYGNNNSTYAQLRKALVEFFGGAELVENVSELPPDHASASQKGEKSAATDVEKQQPGTPSLGGVQQQQRLALQKTTTGVSGVSDLVGDDNGDRPGGYALVIDGSSLSHAFGEAFSKELLLELSSRCQAVVCCRTSPLQKAQIVKLVREGVGALCLAIGDGANDVSMIQAADVGVGVAGEEGLQAVNSSDYAIGQFRFLVRLLTVHGHWSYVRNSAMIVNFFYKEIIGIAVLFFFQFFCGYSTTTVYEYTYLLLYNIIFTLIPPLAIGIFDQDISQRVLMQVPELYVNGRDGNLFGLGRFGVYMIDGIYQGAVCFFFIYFTYNTSSARNTGWDPDMYEMSTIMITAVIFAANLYMGISTRSWNWFVFWSIVIGMIAVWLWTAVYSAIRPGWIWTYVYGNNVRLWPAAYWWLGTVFCVILSLMPRYIFKYYKEMYYPNDGEILRIIDKIDPMHDYRADPAMPYLRDQERYATDAQAGRPSMQGRPSMAESVPHHLRGLQRTRTSLSITHDMATGERRGPSRGFGFDQADGMGETSVGGPLRKYNSNQSRESGARQRPRSRSIKIGGVEVGLPSLGGSVGRNRGGSIFGRHRSGSKAGDQKRSSLQPPSASHAPLASPLREEIAPEEGGAPQQTEAQKVADKARAGAAERG